MWQRTLIFGSSPLARGLLWSTNLGDRAPRIIPARAGFTGGSGLGLRLVQDHPRSRGVYTTPSKAYLAPIGSSPLARGLRSGQLDELSDRGIIPARAGFTRAPGGEGMTTQDHPRSRGVYASSHARAGSASGSSPLARGLPQSDADGPGWSRIIPARAGFTRGGMVDRPRRPDHPRSRGVYQGRSGGHQHMRGSSPLARGLPAAETAWRRTAVGSSPLARGLQPILVLSRLGRRIIPARAGFTPGAVRPGRGLRDHPRSRGVYRTTYPPPCNRQGSSPLARGLQPTPSTEPAPAGIIPARAGFTLRADRPQRGEEDHPRSRGVYTGRSWCSFFGPGSSPLARGLRYRPS